MKQIMWVAVSGCISRAFTTQFRLHASQFTTSPQIRAPDVKTVKSNMQKQESHWHIRWAANNVSAANCDILVVVTKVAHFPQHKILGIKGTLQVVAFIDDIFQERYTRQ